MQPGVAHWAESDDGGHRRKHCGLPEWPGRIQQLRYRSFDIDAAVTAVDTQGLVCGRSLRLAWTMYRIALDARKLQGQITGVGQYVSQLSARLALMAPDFKVYLLYDRPTGHDVVPGGCEQVVLGGFHPDSRSFSMTYSPVWLNTLVPSFIRRTGVDLFHGTNFVLPLHGRCRYVATIHDLTFIKSSESFNALYRCYMSLQVRNSLRRAQCVISVSESTKRDVEEAFDFGSQRIETIHEGVGAEFVPCKDVGLLASLRALYHLPGRFVLHVGTVEHRKNLVTLLRASKTVIDQKLLDGVVLVGQDGRGADEVHSSVVSLGLEPHVSFLGYVPQEQMPAIYSMASVFAFPSLYEGFGLPVLEAMACGTPVVASTTSSLPELTGNAALTFDPGDVLALSSALTKVLADSLLHRQMRSRGLERAKCFSWDTAVSHHLRLYREILSGPSQSA
jgi:glycosyltransferase involved in cell wall biosynthesis